MQLCHICNPDDNNIKCILISEVLKYEKCLGFRICKRGYIHLKMNQKWGAWVAQLVEHLTLDFGSGHDLGFVKLSPMSGSVPKQGVCLRFSLSLFHYASPNWRSHSHSVSKKQRKNWTKTETHRAQFPSSSEPRLTLSRWRHVLCFSLCFQHISRHCFCLFLPHP